MTLHISQCNSLHLLLCACKQLQFTARVASLRLELKWPHDLHEVLH